MKRAIVILLSILVYLPSYTQETSTITDPRDGQVYNIVKIGNQWWMAENLNATKYADGTPMIDGTRAGDITGDITTKYYFWYNDVAGGTIASDQTICSGNDPAAFTSVVDGTGSGTITYQWQSSADNLLFTDIAGETNSTYDAGVLESTTYFRRITISTLNEVTSTAESNVITVAVNQVSGGTIGSDQTICSGDDPAAFTSIVDGTGSGAITYQWQSSADNLLFTDIAGETNSTYDAGVLTQTMYYKRVVTSLLNGTPCTAESNVVTVTVNNITGGTIGSDQTIYSGDDPAAFTSIVDGTGSGAITYQWQSSADNLLFTDIAGETNSTYDAGVLESTTYFRRITTSTLNGLDCSALSNTIIVGVNTEISDKNEIYTDLKIYPNPFTNQTIIEFPNPNMENYRLIITDLSGKVVKLQDNITGSKIELDRGALSEGVYFIELRGRNIYRGRIMIE